MKILHKSLEIHWIRPQNFTKIQLRNRKLILLTLQTSQSENRKLSRFLSQLSSQVYFYLNLRQWTTLIQIFHRHKICQKLLNITRRKCWQLETSHRKTRKRSCHFLAKQISNNVGKACFSLLSCLSLAQRAIIYPKLVNLDWVTVTTQDITIWSDLRPHSVYSVKRCPMRRLSINGQGRNENQERLTRICYQKKCARVR